ncbi:PAS domain S-box protein [Limisalsivibrio acetivorans]|uniref:PAS domain S-box protein n=1 Tax=Limisalsivibrio acetivorans TaxID=1304888 RepID=UPI0003B2F608|nr:PAS domain S-box protein [Limisalsivibrio acetivorans]
MGKTSSIDPYRLIVDNSSSCIFRLATDGTVLYVNPYCYEYFGYTEEEFVGNYITDLIVPEMESTGRNLHELVKMILSEPSKYHIIENENIKKDGTRVWFSWSNKGIFDENGTLTEIVSIGNDITETVNYKREIEENKNFLSSVFDAIQNGIVVLDTNLRVVRVNDVIRDWYGKDIDFIGQKCFECFHMPESDCMSCPSLKAISEKRPFSEVKPLTAPNRKGWMEVFAYPVFNSDGNVTGVVEYMKDSTEEIKTKKQLEQANISLEEKVVERTRELKLANENLRNEIEERKNAEDELRRSNAKFQSLTENMPDVVARFDRKLRHTYVSPVIERYTGKSRNQMLNRTNKELGMPDALVQKWDRFLLDAFQSGEQQTTEFTYYAPSGEVHMQSFAVPEKNDKGVAESVLVVTRDITSLKHSRDMIYQSNRRMLKVLDSLDAIVYVVNLNNDIVVYINKLAREVFGNIISDKINVTYEKMGIDYNSLRIDSKESGTRTELQVGDKWFSFYTREINWYDGKPVSLTIATDVTEKKNLEEELMQMNEALEEKVQKETSLRIHKEQLLIQQSKMAAMGEMIAAIAHQWVQPLNTISLYSQIIKEEFGGEDGDISNYVGIIMNQISYMSQTVDDFRQFFKPSSRLERFSIPPTVSEVYNLLKPQLDKKMITVDTRTDGDNKELMVMGYPNEFKQVMLNLISNAKDSITENDIAPELRVITVEITGDKNILRLIVRDNAGGIDDEVMPNIFEPYFTTKGEKGTGIGLYMSRNIIENRMNGKIYACNHGTGAEFVIELERA